MTKARAHLRICDAYGNRRAVVALEESYYELGADRTRRGETGFIHLEGSGIEARHARLILRSGETRWQVVSLVSTGTKLGRQALAQGTETALEDGAELWLGNNLLQLLDLNRSITEQTVMPELADIELMMNEALLDYEDRRRDLFDGDERQREALLSAELDRLLSVELDLAGKPGMIATINRYCKEALRRPLISACLMSGTRGDIELSFSQLNAEQRGRAIELREELASELRLEMTSLSTAADLRLVHDGFDAAYKAMSGMIGETFQTRPHPRRRARKGAGPFLPSGADPVPARRADDLGNHGLRL